LVDHMLREEILFASGGRYSLGARGEKLYGWRNFAELYAVFSAPQTLRVLFGTQEIGHIDAIFAQQETLEKLSFILGAKAWRAVHIDWKEAIVRVEPVGEGNLARWQGAPELLGRTICQAVREVLVSGDLDAEWSQRTQARLTELRAEYDLPAGSPVSLVSDTQGLRLWTFAGGRANNLLGRVLESKLGEKVTLDNLYIGFRGQAAQSESAIRQALAELGLEGRPNHADALQFAESCARGRISKFQPCLPDRLEAEYLAEVLTSDAEARAVLTLQEPGATQRRPM